MFWSYVSSIHWGDVATWVGAIATFLAVVAALRLHIKVFPPTLHLRPLNPDGRAQEVAIQSPDGSVRPEKARYYDVELSNQRPLIPATNQTVYAVAIDTPDA